MDNDLLNLLKSFNKEIEGLREFMIEKLSYDSTIFQVKTL